MAEVPKLREIQLIDADETYVYRAETLEGDIYWEMEPWSDGDSWLRQLIKAWNEERD